MPSVIILTGIRSNPSQFFALSDFIAADTFSDVIKFNEFASNFFVPLYTLSSTTQSFTMVLLFLKKIPQTRPVDQVH